MTSSSGAAYNEALEYLRPHGTLVAVGLPPDTYIKANVFWTVFKALRITGSYVLPQPLSHRPRSWRLCDCRYVGNRQDAVEALDLAARGKVKAQISIEPLANLESVYHRMETGQLAGRIVLKV
jgi:propanol-preferring alcohol dehydrogenase